MYWVDCWCCLLFIYFVFFLPNLNLTFRDLFVFILILAILWANLEINGIYLALNEFGSCFSANRIRKLNICSDIKLCTCLKHGWDYFATSIDLFGQVRVYFRVRCYIKTLLEFKKSILKI